MAFNLFSDKDVAVIKDLVQWWKSQRANTVNRPRTDVTEDWPAPEMYIARAPVGGIPALVRNDTGTLIADLTDDVPGSAVCQVYRLEEGEVVQVSDLKKTVYNLLPVAIPARAWLTIMRDKFGDWYATVIGLDFGQC